MFIDEPTGGTEKDEGKEHVMATQQQQQPKKFKLIVEELPAGRARVTAEGGALEHADQMDLRSERQRLRFAQGCDAKEPGCLDEILRLLENKAMKLRMGSIPEADDDGCRFVVTGADKFLQEDVDWLWERYVPAGAVTILEGDPGSGKSLVLADLAARVSRGFLAPDRNPAFDEPGHDPEPGAQMVWWLSGQDDFARTTAPRLKAAGADLSMIRVIEGRGWWSSIPSPVSAALRSIRRPRARCCSNSRSSRRRPAPR
jgi:hypothetical protein